MLLKPTTSIRFEPEDREGFRRWHGHPALFFLGAPSEFAPGKQARILQAVREAAKKSQGYRGVRWRDLGVSQVRREESATVTLPGGRQAVYKLSAVWSVEDEPYWGISQSSQTTEEDFLALEMAYATF